MVKNYKKTKAVLFRCPNCNTVTEMAICPDCGAETEEIYNE